MLQFARVAMESGSGGLMEVEINLKYSQYASSSVNDQKGTVKRCNGIDFILKLALK